MQAKMFLVGTLLFVATGCEMLSQRPPAVATPEPLKAPTVLPVQPSEVTAANAKAKLQQLQEELDRESEILDQSPPLP